MNGCYGGDGKEIAQIRSRTNYRVGRDETLMAISGLSVWKLYFTIIGVQVARVKNNTFSYFVGNGRQNVWMVATQLLHSCVVVLRDASSIS